MVVVGQTGGALPLLHGKVAQHLPVPRLAQVGVKSSSKGCQNTKNLREAHSIPLRAHLPMSAATARRKCLSLPSQPEEACESGAVGMRGCANTQC